MQVVQFEKGIFEINGKKAIDPNDKKFECTLTMKNGIFRKTQGYLKNFKLDKNRIFILILK